LGCLIYDRDPKEIQPPKSAPNKEWMIFREFYCPDCGTQVEVEAVPPGVTILHNAEIRF
jgi:acetone carboxylase gamma subunit